MPPPEDDPYKKYLETFGKGVPPSQQPTPPARPGPTLTPAPDDPYAGVLTTPAARQPQVSAGSAPREAGEIAPGVPVPARLRSFYGRGHDVVDMVTGDSRTDPAYKNAPEFQDVKAGGAVSGRTYLATLFANDPNAAADVIQEAFPSAKVFKDSKGNPMVHYMGKDFYVNKPGVSEADFFKFAGDLLAMGGATGALGAFGSRLAGTTLGRMLIGGAGSAAGTAAEDALTGALGGRRESGLGARDILERAGTAGVLGALLPPGARRADLPAPDLQAGRDLARQAGLRPEIYSDTQLLTLSQLRHMPEGPARNEAVNTAASYMRENNLGGTVPELTRGQRGGDVERIAREADTRLQPGGRGVLEPFDKRQTLAFEDRAREFVRGASDEGVIGSRINDEVTRLRNVSQGRVDAAYANVDGNALRFTEQGTPNAMVHVDDFLAARNQPNASAIHPNPTTTPNTVDALARIRDTMRREMIDPNTGRVMRDAAGNIRYEPVQLTLSQAESLRGELVAMRNSAEGRDALGLGRIVRGYDQWMDDALRNGHVAGDTTQLANVQAARAERARHGRLFEPRDDFDVGGDVMQKWTTQGPRQTGQQTTTDILGGGPVSGSGATPQITARLRDVASLDPNSPLMRDVADAAKHRILFNQRADAADTALKSRAQRIEDALLGKGTDATRDLLAQDRQALLAYAEHMDKASLRGRGSSPYTSSSGSDRSSLRQLWPEALGASAGVATGSAIGHTLNLGPGVTSMLSTLGTAGGGAAGHWLNRQGRRIMAEGATQQLGPWALPPPTRALGVDDAGNVILPSLYELMMMGR